MQHRDASKDCVGAGLGALRLNQAHPRPNPLHLAEFLVGLFGCFYFTLPNDHLFNVSFLLLCSEAPCPVYVPRFSPPQFCFFLFFQLFMCPSISYIFTPLPLSISLFFNLSINGSSYYSTGIFFDTIRPEFGQWGSFFFFFFFK